MSQDAAIIDGLQYSRWSRRVFEQMRAGGLDAVHVTVAYWENARELLSRIGAWHQRLRQHADLIRPVTTAGDIRRARAEGRTGILFGLQNCSPIEDDIELVSVLKRLDVHIMQLSYNNQSLLCAGCFEAEDAGITRFGRAVIDEMNRVGMVVDMSHSGERSTLEAIERSRRPIVVSHANPRFWHESARNVSDRVMRALAESGGLLGFSCYPHHLPQGSETTLAAFADMVARTAEVMGVERLGIGTDLCQDQPAEVLSWMRNGRWARGTDLGEGSTAQPDWPAPLPWLRSAADFPRIGEALAARGFSADEVAAVLGGNWLRFLDAGLDPEGGS